MQTDGMSFGDKLWLRILTNDGVHTAVEERRAMYESMCAANRHEPGLLDTTNAWRRLCRAEKELERRSSKQRA